MTQTLFANGPVLTLDRSGTVARGLLVQDDRIIAVGDPDDLRGRAPDASLVDLAGHTVIPGLIDAHSHFARAAFEPCQVDCATPPLSTLDAVLERIAARAAATPPGRWIRGWGFHWSRVAERRSPTRTDLDRVAPANPVVVIDASYHACFANSIALELAGVDRHSTPGRAGIIALDEQGDPTGALLESAMNGPEALSWADSTEGPSRAAIDRLAEHARRHLSLGITGATDALVTPASAALYEAAAVQDRLPITIQLLYGGRRFFDPPDPWHGAEAMRAKAPRLSGGVMKLFMDAVHPGPAIDRPADDRLDVHTGVNYYGRGEARELVVAAVRADLGVAVHALGNCAIDQTLDAFELARAAAPDALLRVEHFVLSSRHQARRAADLGVVVVTNPGFLDAWGDQYLERWRFDGRDDLRVLGIRTLIEEGVTLAAASDHPCAPLDPFHGIWAAVARRSWTGDRLFPEEAVTPEAAIAMYTRAAAVAVGRGASEGTIEPGKVANFVELDRDPRTCSLDALRETTVLATYVEGRPAYEKARTEE